MSRLNANRRRALGRAEQLMEVNATVCQVATVVMHPGPEGINCDLVAYCEADNLIVAAAYMLGVARDRIDRTEPGCTAALAAIEAAMAALPCGPDVTSEARH